MRLYSGTTKSLIEDSTYNRISTKLKDAFFLEYRFHPSVAEMNSWNNSLRAISQVFQAADLSDHGVLLELQLPLTSKWLDCLVTGYNGKKTPNAVIIELKQWEGCRGASGKNESAFCSFTRFGYEITDCLEKLMYRTAAEIAWRLFAPSHRLTPSRIRNIRHCVR